jgi:hypothetical protein
MLLISNGRVIDPASGTAAPRDILIDGDRIAAVAPQGQLATRAKGAEIFDAANFVACANQAASPRKPSRPAHARPRAEDSQLCARCPTRAR